MPNGDIDLDQHRLQAITIVDLQSKVFCGNHLGAIPREMHVNLIRDMQ